MKFVKRVTRRQFPLNTSSKPSKTWASTLTLKRSKPNIVTTRLSPSPKRRQRDRNWSRVDWLKKSFWDSRRSCLRRRGSEWTRIPVKNQMVTVIMNLKLLKITSWLFFVIKTFNFYSLYVNSCGSWWVILSACPIESSSPISSRFPANLTTITLKLSVDPCSKAKSTSNSAHLCGSSMSDWM